MKDKNILLELFNGDNLIINIDFFSTITEKSNLIDTSNKFNLDKSTIATWLNKKSNDIDMYKKIIALYMINTNIEKTEEFHEKYSLQRNTNNLEIISIAFLIPEEDLLSFKTSILSWKNNFIEYLKTLNKYFFVAQINVIRYQMNLPLINLNDI